VIENIHVLYNNYIYVGPLYQIWKQNITDIFYVVFFQRQLHC